MAPGEDKPLNEGGDDKFPEIPTNDKGQMSVPSPFDFPEIPTNDLGFKTILPEEQFPDIDINDIGYDSETE